MKKISLCMAILLIISLLAMPVLAAQSATMTLAVSSEKVQPGDTLTVTVSASAVQNCTSGGFMFSYDKNVFEYVSGNATSALSGFTSGISTAAGNLAGYFMNGNATVQGDIFQITLKVKDDAEVGTYSISGTPSLTASGKTVSCTVVGAEVTVADAINTDNVSVQQYLTLRGIRMWLVLQPDAPNDGKCATYNGETMFYSEKYEAYAYLVIATALDLEDAKALIGVADGEATAIEYSNDVNLTDIIDANDAQFVYNMYNTRYAGFSDTETMEEFFLADVNGDMIIDAADAVFVINALQ